MSLYKRGSTWWVCFTAPNGKRIRQSSRSEDKKQAQEYHDRLKAELWRTLQIGDKPKRSWQEAVIRWLQETNHKSDLLKDKGKLVWLDQHLSGYTLDKISRDAITEIGFIKKLEASPSTANRYLALIRAILRMARDEWEWVDKIPKIKLYPEPKKRVSWLTRKEVDVLVKELPNHLAEMALFTLATGLRQANVSYLTWDQVDMRRGLAWIHADQAKSKKAIAVPLNRDALTILNSRVGFHADYVFTYLGKPVSRTSTRAWKNALIRAGIKNFRWHDLRHTWASWHVQAGTSLQELQELGGWSTFDMVLRYAHLAGDHLKHAASRIEQ